MNTVNQITVVDLTIPVIEFNSERVLTLWDIDRLHRAPQNTTYNVFIQNQNKLQQNKHYFTAFPTDHAFAINYPNPIPPAGLILITQRGYSMLVKAFTDDFSWQVQEQLADAYFEAQRVLSPAEQLVNQANLLVQHDQRINNLEKAQLNTMEHVTRNNQLAERAFQAANAALEHKFGDKDYFTVMAYCKIKNIPTNIALARAKGMQASAYSKKIGIAVNKVQDERFGSVNSYHIDALDYVYQE
ncbi:ORF6N domain-containing protein [Aliivibrio fischeri]|uniref:ORF6N domain-containing protein n=1 Tax=Aliivibrio fischeri TaxID=668 RepID=UPI0007C50CE7|nr:ORF6N domain-containing protein [Aliivibrio fischeri]